MSAAVPPTKFVSNLSCTELTSTGRICTWIAACDLFHESTIDCTAATVGGCQTYVANVRLTTLFFFGAAWAAEAASTPQSRSAAPTLRNLFIEIHPFS